ncbi:Apoptosis-associated speck-like protein containing a CARD [Anabarilius grahami]|uniref:Apoptosis-associated speck-like protein containing a CARD n=1 Tax=Anabarilius grahami TaxID=495550 RepID=A0A3N0YPU5_ANAGA|nr:Apoptosis-associated speck-like protein containing a CARD [Anabarilius grahami]
MSSVKDLLKNSLKDLGDDELKEFQWQLENGYEGITKSDVENADRLDTVDKMVACFGAEEAVKNTVDILKNIKRNDLAEQLENKHKQDQVEGSIEDPTLGARSTPIEGK